MWMNDTPRSSSIASDLNTLSSGRNTFMYPYPASSPQQQFNPQQQLVFNNQFSQQLQQQPPPPRPMMDPRFRTMSSSVFDLNQANTMMRQQQQQPIMNNQQWMPNMQQVRGSTVDFRILFLPGALTEKIQYHYLIFNTKINNRM